MIRPSQVAGYFYPKNKKELNKTIDGFLSNVKKQNFGKVKALIVPHAGYVYSGQVAAHGYKQLDKNFNKVFIFASNHSSNAIYQGASVPSFDYYETPLGKIKVSSIVKELLKHDLFVNCDEAHLTHVEEVQLPFLQKVLENFEIIPIILSNLSESEQKELAKVIEKYLDDKTLIIVSSDLSHFYPYEKAVKLDTSLLKAVETQDISVISQSEACGLEGILVLLQLAKMKKWECKILEYKNSGDTSGNKLEVVGYGAVIFFEET